MAIDANYEPTTFVVDSSDNPQSIEVDDVNGYVKIILTADATVPGKQSVSIDDNFHTDFVVDNTGEPVAIATNSTGSIYIDTDNINIV